MSVESERTEESRKREKREDQTLPAPVWQQDVPWSQRRAGPAPSSRLAELLWTTIDIGKIANALQGEKKERSATRKVNMFVLQ